MISRNFYEIDNNIFFPRIDVSTSSKGSITGVEFPIYNYLIYLASVLFGYENWYGRLINLIFSSVGIFFFHRLLKKYYNDEIAFQASLLLLASAWFAYSRTTFPDIVAASFCIISLYYAFRYFESGDWIDCVFFTILATLGCLTKISATSILAVLILPILQLKFSVKRKTIVSALSILIICIVSVWYFYWVPYLNSIGVGYFSMGFPISMGIQDIINEPLLFAKRFYDSPLKYSGAIAALISFFFAIKNKRINLLLAPIILIAAYFVFILKSGRWFYINGYYFVMYVPAIALLAAIGLSYLQSKLKIIFFIIIITENIVNQVHVFNINNAYLFYTRLESTFDIIGSDRNDLIIVGCDNCSSTAFYMSHRKGILMTENELLDSSQIELFRNRGFKYIMIQKQLFGIDVALPYEIVHDEPDFCIYKL
jgi:4-amino-4-deoxy-L-arabinose transferase-like glycosyltransferase